MKSSVSPWVYGKVILESLKLASANQPAKVYPALVGSVGSLTVLSVVVVAAETTDPPFDW